MPINVKVDDDSPSTKKRRWASPLCKHYNIKESKHFSDGNDGAYCKYCNGGPVVVDLLSSSYVDKTVYLYIFASS